MGSEVLEVIRLRDIIRITSIPGFVPGLSPLTVELKGEDFSTADTVVISGVEVQDFVVVNKTTIYAALPRGVDHVHNLSVLSSGFTRVAEASKIDFRIGTRPRAVKGILKLVQHFLMWLMKDPTTDLFTPTGGGLIAVSKALVSSNSSLKLRAAVTRCVDLTSSQIQRAQASVRNLPVDERLLSAGVVSLGQTRSADEIRAKIKISSFAGDDALAPFRL